MRARSGWPGWGLLLGLCLGAASARAEGSAELRVGGAKQSTNAGAGVTLGLDHGGLWDLAGSYDVNTVTRTALPGSTNSESLLVERNGDAWTWKLGAAYSNDHVNRVTDLQPQASVAYALKRRGGDGDGEELFGVGVDSGLHFYQVDMGDNTQVVSAVPGHLPYTVAKHAVVALREWAPSLNLELPLFHGASTLSWSGGRAGFSQDPALVASIIEERYDLGEGQGRLDGLLGALYDAWWSAGLSQALGAGLTLALDGGQSQLATSGDWVSSFSATLGGEFGGHWSGRLGFDSQVSDGVASNSLQAAAGYAW